jgi:hypothetical protein
MIKTTINKLIDEFNELTLDDKEYMLDIIKKQLIEAKRNALAGRAKKAMSNFKKGFVKEGSVKDLYKDLEGD